MLDKTPRYNLGVVIRETGIKPDTLRAWERRYGLPEPNRTEGGHRLYSEYDIEMIKWLIARQEEGMRISNVVQLWFSLVKDGEDPLEDQLQSARAGAAPDEKVSGLMISELREKWVEACLRFDETAAEHILSQSFALYSLETVCIEILQKGIAKIGELWYQNEASVQQEHFASSLAVRRLNALISAAPPPEHPERTILACVAGELHSFPMLMITLLLRHHGWNIVNLGENVPLERMQQTIQSVNANLTILCAMRLETAAQLLGMVESLRSEKTMLAYGGLIFARQPSLTQRIPAHYLGDDLLNVIQKAEQILRTKPAAPHYETLNGAMLAALYNFREQHLAINAQMIEKMRLSPSLRDFVDYAELHFSRKIVGALTFGDLDLLRDEIDEVAIMIENYGYPAGSIMEYLQEYQQVLSDLLDERGQPIIDWLTAFIQKGG